MAAQSIHMPHGVGPWARRRAQRYRRAIYTGIPSDCTPQLIDVRTRADVQQRRCAAAPTRCYGPAVDDGCAFIDSVWVTTWTGRMGVVTARSCNRCGQPEPGWQFRFSDDWLRCDTMTPVLDDLWRDKATRHAFAEMQQVCMCSPLQC